MFYPSDSFPALNARNYRRQRWWNVALCFSLALALGVGSTLAADDDKEEPPPEPRDIDLITKDPVLLKATYYGSNKGKEAVPIILLHMSEGKRTDYQELALFLQDLGHAVLVPDLRGHGESTGIADSRNTLDASRLPSSQYLRMVADDMEACKKFLIKEHNDGKLNIEKLCIVGSEMGASVAVNWTLLDWSWPRLAVGKQGQDVSALVLISPQWSYKNLRFSEALANEDVRSKVSAYIIVGGNDSRALNNAKRIYKALEPYHASTDDASQRDLFLQSYKTSLQGTELLGEGLGVGENIAKFINLRLVNQSTPWQKRELPLGQ